MNDDDTTNLAPQKSEDETLILDYENEWDIDITSTDYSGGNLELLKSELDLGS
ncbi:MAG: hypothetical protein GY896_02255 [Gammaproteobacteria bacterium]|nr:hypothetical protein [Gammaproteobacteria bacterium]